MSAIKVYYDLQTGEIKGYYPSNLAYKDLPSPLIDISAIQYATILHNEGKFRIQNKELVDISNTADYRLSESKKLLNDAALKISEKAIEAESWGVILVDEKYYINVHWKDYYASLLSILEAQAQDLCIKVYVLENSKYYMDYNQFEAAEAKTFLENAISAINNYCTQYIPEKQAEFSTKLKTIKKSKTSSGIVNFIEEINYGYTINESETTVPLKV